MTLPPVLNTALHPANANQQLEEIVVVARKVEENIQTVPVAITAYSGAALGKQGARTIPDVASLTRSLRFAPAHTSTAAVLIQMRGQTQSDTLSTVDPSVGTYVDGLCWTRAYGLGAQTSVRVRASNAAESDASGCATRFAADAPWSMRPATGPGATCCNISRASKIPAACSQLWAASAPPRWSAERPNLILLLWGRIIRGSIRPRPC